MQRTGHIARWDPERGFGFIATAEGQRNIFFHVRDFGGATPAEGMAVRFEQIEVGGKGPRAMAVQPVGAAPLGRGANRVNAGTGPRQSGTQPRPSKRSNGPSSRTRSGGTPRLGAPYTIALLLWCALLGWGYWRGAWPLTLLGGLLALNVITFFSYAFDKSAAERGQWRTPEKTLHLLALAGGWPAAGLAQQALRHKSATREFLVVYALTVLLNLAALGWWVGWGAKAGYL